jgi:hypothetical protein
MTAQQSDIGRVLADAAKLADEIMKLDRASPGFAVAVVRNVVRLMTPADALAVIGHTTKPKPTPPIISIDALIG